MPLGFFAREWERACSECGYTWRLPRSIARRGIRGMAAVGVFGDFISTRRYSVGSSYRGTINTRAELMEGFRTCAKCGADHFTQRPVIRHG